MKPDSTLAHAIDNGDFIVTAEYLPRPGTGISEIAESFSALADRLTAVNVADNPHGIALSSLAGCIALKNAGVEPVLQILTRDRNRIALQSDLLGASSIGIRNILCLSGHHQALSGVPESANVFDIDSIQLLSAVSAMTGNGLLMDGTEIEGKFAMLPGASVNPSMQPLDLAMMRFEKKIDAGARFLQTEGVFDIEAFRRWLAEACERGLTDRTAVIAGVRLLSGAEEAERLRDTFTGIRIPDSIITRLKSAGGDTEARMEGLRIAVEIINSLKSLEGIRGIHILSGGNEDLLPDVFNAVDV